MQENGVFKINSGLKEFLDEMVAKYNQPSFIEPDPISIPHRYSLKEDVEIASFLAATIAWGNRKTIVKNGHKMLDLLGQSPYDFVMSFKQNNLKKLNNFVHRTFNDIDFKYFLKSLRNIYLIHGGMQAIFVKFKDEENLQSAISNFKTIFFELPHLKRTEKHVSDPSFGSSAKRINMMLRWLIRCDDKGVDFGIWKKLHPSQLSCPLDIHSGNTARKIGLIHRKQNDSKTVQELDLALRSMDKLDPVKYDFALFGLGISKSLLY